MAKRTISLTLSGFDELLTKINKAGGSIDGAVTTCMKESAQTMHEELKKQMTKSKVKDSLIKRMPLPEIEVDRNVISAQVGYEKGKYNPDKLTDGYKVLFLNYGTPRRKPSKEKARGFIKKAKRKATPIIKKQQEETLNAILKELK